MNGGGIKPLNWGSILATVFNVQGRTDKYSPFGNGKAVIYSLTAKS